MRNAALPRDLAVTVPTVAVPPRPMPLRSFWRARRRANVGPVAVPSPPATLRREHGAEVSGHPTSAHPVLVHDFSISAVELRSRLPLDVSGHYRLHSDAHGLMLRGSRVRIVSCRREPGGLYAVGAEICR